MYVFSIGNTFTASSHVALGELAIGMRVLASIPENDRAATSGKAWAPTN